MPTITSRVYASPADLDALGALLERLRAAGRAPAYPTLVDLTEFTGVEADRANLRLWFADETPVAFSLFEHYGNLWFAYDTADPTNQADPAATISAEAGEKLAEELVAWGETCARRAAGAPDAADPGEGASMDTNCRAEDAERIALLERHGFERQGATSVKLSRPLDGPIPEPTLPPGYAIRPAIGEAEASALVELHRAAFGTEYMTVEERLSMMRTPEYVPELDLVATAPDGTLAAYCMASIERADDGCPTAGCTDPVATRPGHQGRGLGAALLLTALRELKLRGARVADLGTSGDNLAMLALAKRVGFTVTATSVWFSKAVRA